jgi:hypothetical protein
LWLPTRVGGQYRHGRQEDASMMETVRFPGHPLVLSKWSFNPLPRFEISKPGRLLRRVLGQDCQHVGILIAPAIRRLYFGEFATRTLSIYCVLHAGRLVSLYSA